MRSFQDFFFKISRRNLCIFVFINNLYLLKHGLNVKTSGLTHEYIFPGSILPKDRGFRYRVWLGRKIY
jgi:hypothetical protein